MATVRWDNVPSVAKGLTTDTFLQRGEIGIGLPDVSGYAAVLHSEIQISQ